MGEKILQKENVLLSQNLRVKSVDITRNKKNLPIKRFEHIIEFEYSRCSSSKSNLLFSRTSN